MIYTARQLADLHKAQGRLALPVGARLTPLASDWLRQKKLKLEYVAAAQPQSAASAPAGYSQEIATPDPPTSADFLWWCDGPCGTAKAAISAEAREFNLQPLDIPAEARRLVCAVKAIASAVKAGKVHGAVLLVETGAAAMIYANRCPSLRAILGTCREAVEQGVKEMAANVLVIEYPHVTLSQARNVLSRFLKSRIPLSDDRKRELEEMATCG